MSLKIMIFYWFYKEIFKRIDNKAIWIFFALIRKITLFLRIILKKINPEFFSSFQN